MAGHRSTLSITHKQIIYYTCIFFHFLGHPVSTYLQLFFFIGHTHGDEIQISSNFYGGGINLPNILLHTYFT